ncbi:MAG: outer membrane beta-barrel protein [FCB group bacterium]|nr:outer membrane beta-barrel protein [FCB group bacterium]
MKTIRLVSLGVILLLIVTGSANAQYSLDKRHQIGLRAGMWNQSTGVRTAVSPGAVVTSVGSSGAMGGVQYGYWFEENLALNIFAGAMMADVETAVDYTEVSTETAQITSILFGLKYYPIKSTLAGKARPYLKGSAGMFVGSQTKTEVGYEIIVESRNETVIGGRLEAGSDFILSRHFLFDVAIGYNLMSEFSEPVGGSSDYSGPEFSLGFSYLFGKGVQ